MAERITFDLTILLDAVKEFPAFFGFVAKDGASMSATDRARSIRDRFKSR